MNEENEVEKMLDEYQAFIRLEKFWKTFVPVHQFNLLRCNYCKKDGARRRRQNTAYCEDERNYIIACDKCAEEINEHWDDQWAEYWSGCL